MLRTTAFGITAFASLCFAQPALSQIVTGSDDGSAVGGPHPNSAAAEADFFADASAYGTISTLTFEGQPTGYSANYTFPGVGVTTTAPNYGSGFSGVSNSTFGNLYGYDIDTGAGSWFGVPGGLTTFTFDSPTNAFGFYLTGLQSNFGSLVVTDDQGQIYNLTANSSGGAQYFGATTGYAISSFTITDGGSGDAWGLDRLSFLTATAVPEPSTWAMMLIGFGATGFALRRRRRSSGVVRPQLA